MSNVVRHIVSSLILGTAAGLLAAPFVSSAMTFSTSHPSGIIVGIFDGADAAGLVGEWIDCLISTASNETPLLIASVVLGVLVVFGVIERRAARNPQREIVGGAFGSQTSIESHSEIIRRCRTWKGEEASDCGFVVGYCKGRCVLTDAIHAAICAPSGSYKTRASVLPSVACISLARRGNLVVTDPSLEIWCYSRLMLEGRGYDAMLIDLENPYRGSRVNFLLPLVKLHEQGLDYLAEEQATEIGALLFPETGGERDDFAQPAAGLVAAVSYLVATSDEIPRSQKHLGSVIATLLEGTAMDGSGCLKEWLRGFGADSPAVGMAATFLSATDRYEASILGTLHTGLRPFNTTAMRYLVSGGDVDFEAMLTRPSALFLHTLNPGMPGNRLASLAFAQLWAATVRNGQRRGSNRPTWYLLDEAHSVPPFGLPTILEQSRKYDCHFAIYLQSFSGLDPYKTAKEDGKDAILANCDCKALFRAGSEQDALYFERLSGKATYLARNTGESRNSRDSSSSTGFSERDRPVWLAGDIMQRDPMRDGILLFQNPTNHPESMGKFEVPIEEISKIPFLVEQFGTIGSREREAQVIGAEIDRLDAIAAKKASAASCGAWSPDFNREQRNEEQSDEELFGL